MPSPKHMLYLDLNVARFDSKLTVFCCAVPRKQLPWVLYGLILFPF